MIGRTEVLIAHIIAVVLGRF